MTRQIVLDTETTGLNPRIGNRIIEIGCVELINRKLTGNNFHFYLNPERDSEEGALAVHGLTTAFLSDKPKFQEIAESFLNYVRDAEVVIHNAPFDVGFLNAELERLGCPNFETYVSKVTDTLVQAKQLHPGKRNSLDALCDRYEISNSHRKLHGALLDAELLSDVFLAMSRGQNSLGIEHQAVAVTNDVNELVVDLVLPSILVIPASATELAQHEDLLRDVGKASSGLCIWSLG
ncbi:MAG: DNA polymerase III subunit epsilon [Undibacterium sp.]|nr:DNA polymerase III subunit epsilon [Undibacterium sp.]